jgi:crotonobetainyl-CoA:carnitine CoA-transferase CaiB-like acyl-CoA transferase
MRQGPLQGVRVLGLENFIAGPYGSMIMGDLGAEVIKIEPPGGDFARHFAGPGHKGEVFYYLAFNRNKKSIMLDLMVDSNKKAFYDLVRVSDVVWDNFRPGVTERLGIDYETLKQINPRIVCCSITGYGETGPRKDQLSYDVVGQAISGMMGITGEPGRPPVRCGPPVGDLVSGILGVIGVLSALVARETTGRGQKVEVSLLDSCVSLLAYYFSYYFCSGEAPGPQGSGHLGVSPYGAFRTRDGRWIATGINWPRITRVVGAEWIADDPRFQSQEGRVKHRKELEDILQEHFLEADAQQWLDLFEVEDIAGGLVQNIAEAANDPQILNNRMILSLKHPLGGEVRLVGNPVKTGGVNEDEYAAPPTLGQHTQEVFKVLLGYSKEEVGKVREEAEAHAQELSEHLHKTI